MDLDKLKSITQQVELITDGLELPIDPGIKKAVIAFNYVGLPTSMSCEGHMDWGCPYPWIDVDDDKNIDINSFLQKKAQDLLDEFYSDRERNLFALQIQLFACNSFRVQSTNYTPRAITIPSIVRDQIILSVLQKEMNDFADYLLK